MKITVLIVMMSLFAGNAIAGQGRKPAATKGKSQDCLIQAEALVKAKYPGASHNSDNADTEKNFLFYIWQKGCWFDVNVSVEDKAGRCSLGKPTLDDGSANCG